MRVPIQGISLRGCFRFPRIVVMLFLLIKQSFFNKTIIYFYGKSIQMEIINDIIVETRAYS